MSTRWRRPLRTAVAASSKTRTTTLTNAAPWSMTTKATAWSSTVRWPDESAGRSGRSTAPSPPHKHKGHGPRTVRGLGAPVGVPHLVGEGGLEPPRPEGHWHLKPARLPFRHSPEITERGYHDGASAPQLHNAAEVVPPVIPKGRLTCTDWILRVLTVPLRLPGPIPCKLTKWW